MKKLFTRTAALLLALIISLTATACAAPNDSQQPGTDNTAAENNANIISITVTTTEETLSDDNGVEVVDVTADTIEVSGGGEGAAEKIAAFFDEQYVQPGAEYIEIQREATAQVMEDMGLDAHSYYKRTVSTPRSDEGLFVLYVQQGFYSLGAAHGSDAASAINFDPVTGEKISLSDIGVNGADPTEDIARLLTDKYMSMEQSGDYSDNWDATYATISYILSDEFNQWYLYDDGFALISNPYDLASYATGKFEITLPSEELSGIVDDCWFS